MLKRIAITGAAVLIALSNTAVAQATCVNNGQDALNRGEIYAAINIWLPCAQQSSDGEIKYRLGAAYSAAGERSNALLWLDRAIASGNQQSPQPWWLADATNLRAYTQ